MDKEIAKIITSKIMELQDENGCWNFLCEVDYTRKRRIDLHQLLLEQINSSFFSNR